MSRDIREIYSDPHKVKRNLEVKKKRSQAEFSSLINKLIDDKQFVTIAQSGTLNDCDSAIRDSYFYRLNETSAEDAVYCSLKIGLFDRFDELGFVLNHYDIFNAITKLQKETNYDAMVFHLLSMIIEKVEDETLILVFKGIRGVQHYTYDHEETVRKAVLYAYNKQNFELLLGLVECFEISKNLCYFLDTDIYGAIEVLKRANDERAVDLIYSMASANNDLNEFDIIFDVINENFFDEENSVKLRYILKKYNNKQMSFDELLAEIKTVGRVDEPLERFRLVEEMVLTFVNLLAVEKDYDKFLQFKNSLGELYPFNDHMTRMNRYEKYIRRDIGYDNQEMCRIQYERIIDERDWAPWEILEDYYSSPLRFVISLDHILDKIVCKYPNSYGRFIEKDRLNIKVHVVSVEPFGELLKYKCAPDDLAWKTLVVVTEPNNIIKRGDRCVLIVDSYSKYCEGHLYIKNLRLCTDDLRDIKEISVYFKKNPHDYLEKIEEALDNITAQRVIIDDSEEFEKECNKIVLYSEKVSDIDNLIITRRRKIEFTKKITSFIQICADNDLTMVMKVIASINALGLNLFCNPVRVSVTKNMGSKGLLMFFSGTSAKVLNSWKSKINQGNVTEEEYKAMLFIYMNSCLQFLVPFNNRFLRYLSNCEDIGNEIHEYYIQVLIDNDNQCFQRHLHRGAINGSYGIVMDDSCGSYEYGTSALAKLDIQFGKLIAKEIVLL